MKQPTIKDFCANQDSFAGSCTVILLAAAGIKKKGLPCGQQHSANIEDWLDQFDMFSIYEVLPQILELWGENLVTDVTSKKRLAEVSGK